jgi:RNA polymerase sigma factor for flagellar operon FliA
VDAPDPDDDDALVRRIANEAASEFDARSELEDLMQAGAEALLKLRKSFDPERGIPFAGYAYRRIRGAMIDTLRGAEAGRLTRSALDRCRRADQVAATLEAADEEIAKRPPTGDIEATAAISALMGKVAASYIADVVASAERDATEDGLIARIDSAKLHVALAKLPEEEREVVTQLYFGEKRLARIGAEAGHTESWASRAHTEALRLLREALT